MKLPCSFSAGVRKTFSRTSLRMQFPLTLNFPSARDRAAILAVKKRTRLRNRQRGLCYGINGSFCSLFFFMAFLQKLDYTVFFYGAEQRRVLDFGSFCRLLFRGKEFGSYNFQNLCEKQPFVID